MSLYTTRCTKTTHDKRELLLSKTAVWYNLFIVSLYFVTGNKAKFEELKAIIPQLEQIEIDLPENQ